MTARYLLWSLHHLGGGKVADADGPAQPQPRQPLHRLPRVEQRRLGVVEPARPVKEMRCRLSKTVLIISSAARCCIVSLVPRPLWCHGLVLCHASVGRPTKEMRCRLVRRCCTISLVPQYEDLEPSGPERHQRDEMQVGSTAFASSLWCRGHLAPSGPAGQSPSASSCR